MHLITTNLLDHMIIYSIIIESINLSLRNSFILFRNKLFRLIKHIKILRTNLKK